MAIAYDNAGSITATGVSTVNTAAWACAGDFIIAGMGWAVDPGGNYSSITWNSDALTQIGSTVTYSTYFNAALASRVAPDNGTYVLSGTVSATCYDLVVGAITYSGVDQSTPVDTLQSASGVFVTPQTATVNVSSETNDLVVDVAFANAGQTPSTVAAGAGQTMRWERETWGDGGAYCGTQSEESGSATVTMSEVFTCTDGYNIKWGICAVNINVAAAAGNVKLLLLNNTLGGDANRMTSME